MSKLTKITVAGLLALSATATNVPGFLEGTGLAHQCTDADKQAEFCTEEFNQVCGDNGQNYSNGCNACKSRLVKSWVLGPCVTFGVPAKKTAPKKAAPKKATVPGFLEGTGLAHQCTDAEKKAEMCTADFHQVCG